jgi:hypothetical protein
MSELAHVEPVAFDADALADKTFAKLGLERPAAQAAAAPARRMPRKFAVALVAACVLVIGVPSAYAIGGLLAKMGAGEISFFGESSGAAGQTGDLSDANTPTYYVAMQDVLETSNAPVNQTLSFDGGSITLDAIAVDDNFINSFFTIRYDAAIDARSINGFDSDKRVPGWADLQVLVPWLEFTVDGAPVVATPTVSYGGGFESDPYYVDEHSIAVMVHAPLSVELPDVFDLSVSLPAGIAIADGGETVRSTTVEGAFAFTVDKSALSAADRAATPGSYSVTTPEGTLEMVLDKLSVSPFGAVAMLDGSSQLDLSAFTISDEEGNTAVWYLRSGLGVVSGDTLANETAALAPGLSPGEAPDTVYELLGLNPQTASVTLTPVHGFPLASEVPAEGTFEWRVVDFNTLQAGDRIATSDVGGFVFDERTIEDGTVRMRLTPYGYVGDVLGFELSADYDDAQLAEILTSDRRIGIQTSYFDLPTGQLVLNTSYYAADDATLEQMHVYHYVYQNGLSLNEEAAFTLPLS